MLEAYKHLLINDGVFVTKNFKLSELNHSNYAAAHNVKNVAEGLNAQNQQWLAIVLQIIRDTMGVPMVVNSGYRSPYVNKKVNGSATSAHMHGSAADVFFTDTVKTYASQRNKAVEVGKLLDSVGIIYDQIIYYDRWVHIGMNFQKLGRRQIFRGEG